MAIHWQWSPFGHLTRDQLYEILRVRQEVFSVEQNCAYQDADGKDQQAWHLAAWREARKRTTESTAGKGNTERPELLAYLRVVFPGAKYAEPSIGRVLTSEAARGSGLGRELMRRAIEHTLREYPETDIRISAQQHLERFYGEFGFEQLSGPYDEDGIPHIEMLRRGAPTAAAMRDRPAP